MNILGDNIVDDANNMFDYINKFKGKDFILDKIDNDTFTYTKRK